MTLRRSGAQSKVPAPTPYFGVSLSLASRLMAVRSGIMAISRGPPWQTLESAPSKLTDRPPCRSRVLNARIPNHGTSRTNSLTPCACARAGRLRRASPLGQVLVRLAPALHAGFHASFTSGPAHKAWTSALHHPQMATGVITPRLRASQVTAYNGL